MSDPSPIRTTIPLPAGFRANDVLAFHRRDSEQLAEQVTEQRIRKGLFWDGVPACLTLVFASASAAVELAVDGPMPQGSSARLEQMVRRMLGLTQPVEAFEVALADHPQLGPVIARNRGLRVPQTATPFEALTWAVTGQQISVSAAVSVRRRFILAAGAAHSSGLWCVPDARRVAQTGAAALQGAGLSRTKAATLRAVSEEVVAGRLALEDPLADTSAEAIGEQLNAVKGIGPWTVSYALMRGFGWMDGSLHGDVAVRRNLQALLETPEKPTEAETRAWLEPFSPWRALVAAHLWGLQSTAGY
ncbi:DNA-3-methyladenine glycosylase family protein [Marinobacter halodurans]|uniref:DNA-3-methyladenine glycosylase family protein n=1 Tax=Marinobacter halodurans TaxID=2528979 RepID=UPI0026CAA164